MSDSEEDRYDSFISTIVKHEPNPQTVSSKASNILAKFKSEKPQVRMDDIFTLTQENSRLMEKVRSLQHDLNLFNQSENYELLREVDNVAKVNPNNPDKIRRTLNALTNSTLEELPDTEDLEVSDRCEWVHNEEEALSVLHLFKPGRYVEYCQLIKSNVGEQFINGVKLKDNKNEREVIDIPQTKYGSQLMGFRIVLKPIKESDSHTTFFNILNGSLTVQSIKYSIKSSLVTPRIKIPFVYPHDESLFISASNGRRIKQPIGFTGLSVDPMYVRDIYGIYRINSSIISDKFRSFDFYGKYKFNASEIVKIFQHNYDKLQEACSLDQLDIVEWIVGFKFDELVDTIRWDNVYIYQASENDRDSNPQARLTLSLLVALRSKSLKVAKYLLKLFDVLKWRKCSVDDMVSSACASGSFDCIELVVDYKRKYNEYIESLKSSITVAHRTHFDAMHSLDELELLAGMQN